MFIRHYVSAAPAAFLITIGLGVCMANLIKVSFKPPSNPPELLSFEINSVVADIKVATRTVSLDKLPKVIVPPAPPVSEYTSAKVPSPHDFQSAEIIIPGPIVDISRGFPDMIGEGFGPTIRVPPVMPHRATRSGHCVLRFDVNAEGSPFNVGASSCSSSVFRSASIKAVKRWKYRPKIVNRQPVTRAGVEATIRFVLTGADGKLIPE